MKGRVLVTGASGFIGRRVVAALAKEGWQVRAAARNPASLAATRGVDAFLMPDLARRADWSGLVEGVTHIVHLAGIAHAPGALPDAAYTRINAEAVGELAQAARGKIERFVFISSVRAQATISSARPARRSTRAREPLIRPMPISAARRKCGRSGSLLTP